MSTEIEKAKRQLKEIYDSLSVEIRKRIMEFKIIGEKGDENRIFMELVFCLLTPASKAKNAWLAVETLHKSKLLYNGKESEISGYLNTVRFKNNKAKNIVLARELFFRNDNFRLFSMLRDFNDAFRVREWLVKNIKGMAYKESTHFLRNIGRSGDLCILDRHILKNLYYYSVIEDIPSSLSRKTYLSIERKMQEFSRLINIPVIHLDLILWYKETGEIFK